MPFTRRAETRIASAVKRVEGMPPAPARGPNPLGFSGDEIVAVKLTENMGATTSGEAAAVLVQWSASAETMTDTATAIACVDPFGIFTDGTSGSYGFAYARGGADRTVFLLIQLECPT